jgi:threonine dehydrogenase-like Zn-dependent dehydrogenase
MFSRVLLIKPPVRASIPCAESRYRDSIPHFVMTHRCKLEGPEMYKTFQDKEDGCIKVVLHP